MRIRLRSKKYGNRLKMEPNGCYRIEFNSKAFAIPILTAYAFKTFGITEVRIGVADTNFLKYTQ